MFEDFFAHCRPNGEIKPSKKRVNKNIAAVKSLIETEGSTMTKRRFRFKPLIITAAIIIASVVSILTVNASTGGIVVNFIMGGEEIEGGYRDYVDHDGYRHVSFKATIPFSEEYYVVIFDVEAETTEEAVRVITSDTDPDFIENLRQYRAAEDKAGNDAKAMWDKIYEWKGRDMHDDDTFERDRVKQEALEAGVFDPSEWPISPEPEDFGIVLKDSELLCYNVNFYYDGEFRGFGGSGNLGGEFMFMDVANGHPSGAGPRHGEKLDDDEGHIDYENGTLNRTFSFYYYVGKK